MLNPHEIEEAILSLTQALEKATDDYREICRNVAKADADFKESFHTSIVNLADADASRPKQDRDSVGLRESRAHVASMEQYRNKVLYEEKQKANNAVRSSLQSRLDSYRTLSASARALGA